VRQGRSRRAVAQRVNDDRRQNPGEPSGELACFGEAIPTPAIAQVCELTWQLKAQADSRQVEGATVGITTNQGLFGHGSSVIVTR
jgi:acetyl-CoA acetyltransferase